MRDAAAVGLAHLGPLPEAAWPALREALLREAPPDRGDVPWWEDFSPLDDRALGRPAPGTGPWRLAWPSLPDLANAQLGHSGEAAPDRVGELLIAVVEQDGPRSGAASAAIFGWLFASYAAGAAPNELQRRFLVAHARSDRLLVPALSEALQKDGLPGDRAGLRALLGLPPHPADVRLALAGREGTLAELVAAAPAAELGAAAADRPTTEAVALADELGQVSVELSKSPATRPLGDACWEAVRATFAELAGRADLEPALRALALPRVGRPAGDPGMWAGPVVLTIGAAALARAGVVPGPWAEPMLARAGRWAMVADDIAAVLGACSSERRREALTVVGRIHREHVLAVAAGCCRDAEDVRAAVGFVLRYGPDSRFDVEALGRKLAEVGPVARPVWAQLAADPQVHWRRVFEVALEHTPA